MKNSIKTGLTAACLLLAVNTNAAVVGLDLIESGDDAVADINSVFNSTDVTVIAGSEVFNGAQGDVNGAQSAIFDSLNISNSSTSLSMGEGFLLTSGTANTASGNTNTANQTSFSNGGSGDPDLVALATANSLNTSINNVNTYEFTFTLAQGLNAVTLDFLFATEEFPTQTVTDIFGIFVDGVNYAFFNNGNLVNNNGGAQFNNNAFGTADPFDIEYNGFSDVLSVVGLVDTSLTEHVLKIAIADTSDTIYDSAAFIGNLGATTATVGGINPNPNPVNAPATLGLVLLGAGLFIARKKR